MRCQGRPLQAIGLPPPLCSVLCLCCKRPPPPQTLPTCQTVATLATSCDQLMFGRKSVARKLLVCMMEETFSDHWKYLDNSILTFIFLFLTSFIFCLKVILTMLARFLSSPLFPIFTYHTLLPSLQPKQPVTHDLFASFPLLPVRKHVSFT